VGISFFPYAHYDLSSENLLRLPYGSGSEAVFNFAVNLYTLKMLRALSSSVSNSKLDKALYTLNIGEVIHVSLYLIHICLLLVLNLKHVVRIIMPWLSLTFVSVA